MRTFSTALAETLKSGNTSAPREIFLDGRFAFQKDDSFQELSQLTDLKALSLGSCALRGPCLASFPPLPALTSLSLTDNAVSGDLHHLTVLSSLKDLDLSGNRLADLSALSPLTALTGLTSVDISGCPAETKDPDTARKEIFKMLAVLPALKYVNGEDLYGHEKPVDDEGGSEEEEEEDDDYEGEEEGDDDEEAGEGAEEGGAGAGGEAGGDEDDDDDNGGDGGDDDDEEGDDDGEEEEEVPTAALVQQDLMSDDEEEFLVGEEEEEEDEDFDSDEDDAPPARKRAKKAAESEDDEEEEDEDEDDDSDYDGDD